MEEKILSALARVTEVADGALTASEENSVVTMGTTLLLPYVLAGKIPSDDDIEAIAALADISPSLRARVSKWLRSVVRNASILSES